MSEAAREALQKGAASIAPPPREERQHDDGHQQQDEDEPEVADPEAAVIVVAVLDVPLEEVAARDVVPVRASVAGVEARAVVGLRRDQHENAEDERDSQAQDPLSQILPVAAPAQRKTGRGAGQQEEQLHAPRGDEVEQIAHRRRQDVGLYVPGVVGVEDAQGVEREQQQDGQHAQPVNVVNAGPVALERGGGRERPFLRLQSPRVDGSPGSRQTP